MSDRLPFADAARALLDAEIIALACHVGPDGDALGSMLGLARAASQAGVEVHPSFGGGFEVPDSLSFLDTELLVEPGAVPASPSLMVVLDVGSPDRLGELSIAAEGAGQVIVVDHHASNTGFGDIRLIDPDAAATAELVIELIDACGWSIDSTTAQNLLTAIVTDTGRFQYPNTKARTLRYAARLVEAGARPEIIGRHIYEESPFGFLKVSAIVLDRATLEPDLDLVWSVLTNEDLDIGGIGIADTDPLIDLVRTARESEVAVLVKQQSDGGYKASLRSRGTVDVGSIAADLGGGGHHNASGFTALGGPEEAMAEIRKRLLA